MSDKEWWYPWEIAREWSWDQVRWVLRHYYKLREGQWPNPDGSSGYTTLVGIEITKGRRKWGYFETPCDIAAEAWSRLERLGPLAQILRLTYMHGETLEQVAKDYRMSVPRMYQWRRLGMYYMQGRNRREIP